jgi:hypothetical protein
MGSDPLYALTLFTSFIGMAFSLWFAIYLLARSEFSHLIFRAVLALLALACYFYAAFSWIVDPTVNTESIRSLGIIVALIAAHDLTHYLLPPGRREKTYWLARAIVLVGIGCIFLLFLGSPKEVCDPLYICPAQLLLPWSLVSLFELLVFAAILYNLWLIKQSENRAQNTAFFIGVLLAVSSIGYGFLGVIFNVDLPRFVPTVLVLSALSLLGYSVARHQTLVTRRTTRYDFPVTLATIVIVVGIYALIAWQVGLSLSAILVLTVLVILTHSAYDFVRDILDRLFRGQERQLRRELRNLGRDTFGVTSLQRYLRRGLAILCHNLEASSGFVALRRENQFVVVASLHSLPVDTPISIGDASTEEVTRPEGQLSGRISWLAPAYGGREQVAVVGIGDRQGLKAYSEEDIDWLEDVADEIGAMVFAHQDELAIKTQVTYEESEPESQKPDFVMESDELLAILAYKPDPQMVRCVEEGFRQLHDYSKLGRSPLVAMFGVSGEDHIERGKQVQGRLMLILEKLRPGGKPPAEPLPREWYPYTILHDAYVQEKPAREIMGKLYISEGTYYRTRRRALRGVTRALLEVGTFA